MDLDTVKTIAAVVSAIAAVGSWTWAMAANRRSVANEKQLVSLQQQFADYSKKSRGGAGGQGGAAGTVTISDSEVRGEIRAHGGAGGRGGDANT